MTSDEAIRQAAPHVALHHLHQIECQRQSIRFELTLIPIVMQLKFAVFVVFVEFVVVAVFVVNSVWRCPQSRFLRLDRPHPRRLSPYRPLLASVSAPLFVSVSVAAFEFVSAGSERAA